MRTLHLLIGTLLLVVQGHAQPSHWPTSNASWKVFHTQAHGLVVWVSPFQLDIINGLLFTEVTYTLGNDTLLGGQQYTAVYQAWDSQFESVPGAQVDTTVNYPPQGPVFRGGFRSMGQQVYFWNVQDQSEHLLYDFDLQVGDPLPISFVYQNANATVASIDTLMLGGSMMPYLWTIDGQSWGTHRPVEARSGERVTLTFHNMSMMAHPMHLHGHHFQVVALNGRAVNGARRDTVHVPPMGMVTVALDAGEAARWMLHCHHMPHLATGMMTEFVVSA